MIYFYLCAFYGKNKWRKKSGRFVVTREEKIKYPSDLAEIERQIEKEYGLKSCGIFTYKLMNEGVDD